MRREKDRFVFTPEMGTRLRELRRKAGLTQLQLARAMGWAGKRAGTIVSRLESGQVKHPTLGLVADFLRACRVGFSDILDILNRYTSRPDVIEQTTQWALVKMREYLPDKVAKTVQNYDIAVEVKREVAGKPKLEPLKRLARARATAAARFRWQTVNRMLYQAVNHAGVPPTYTAVIIMVNHGHKVFRILYNTRKRKPARREELLSQAEEWLVGQKVLPREAVRFIQDAVRDLYDKMERSGQLDWQPDWTLDDLDTVLLTPTRRRELRQQHKDDFRQKLEEHKQTRERVIDGLWQEVQPLLTEAGAPETKYPLYRSVVLQVCSIADHEEPESERAKGQVEAYVTNERNTRLGVDPDLARRVVAHVIARYSELRKTLPSDPHGWTRPA